MYNYGDEKTQRPGPRIDSATSPAVSSARAVNNFRSAYNVPNISTKTPDTSSYTPKKRMGVSIGSNANLGTRPTTTLAPRTSSGALPSTPTTLDIADLAQGPDRALLTSRASPYETNNTQNRPMDTITRANGQVVPMNDVLAERRKASARIGNVSGQAPLSTTSGGPRSSQYGQEAQDIVSRIAQPFGGSQQTQPEAEGFVDAASSDVAGWGSAAGNNMTNSRRYGAGYGVSSPQIDALKAKAAETDAFYRGQLPSQYDPVDQQIAQENSVRSFTQTSPETSVARTNAQAYENPLGEQQANTVAPVSMNAFSAPLGSSTAQDDNPYSVMNQVKALDKQKAEEERAKKRETFQQAWEERRKKMDEQMQARTDAYRSIAKGPATLEPEQNKYDYSPYGEERNRGGRSRYDTRWQTGW